MLLMFACLVSIVVIGTFLAITRVQLKETRRKLTAAETMCGHLRNSKRGMISGWPVEGYSVRVNGMESPLYKVSPLFAQFDAVGTVDAKECQIVKGGEVIYGHALNQSVALLAGDRLNLSLDLECLQELKS